VPIGDDGQSLERGHRELGPAGDLEELPQIAVELGTGDQANPPGHLLDDDALGRICGVPGDHLVEGLTRRLALALVEDLQQLAARNRLRGDKEHGFESCSHFPTVGHPSIASSSCTWSSRAVR
jgi:hypothetical protein